MTFIKGQSGNPLGRPRLPGKKELIEKLEKLGAIDKALLVLVEGLNSNNSKFESCRFILEQVYGKAIQRNELTGEDGAEIKVNIIMPEGSCQK